MAPTDLRVGRAAKPLWTNGWQQLKTGDEAFDAACQTWSKISGKPGGMLSKAARGALLGLMDAHPNVHLFIDGKDVTLTYPGTDLDRPRLGDFVLKAASCVDTILGPR